jgi:nitrogen fixation/metabolism regulation signal transduction histidine kinase
LGLAIVKKIIDEHGGRVLLSNAPERGARVTIVLPWHATGTRISAAAA